MKKTLISLAASALVVSLVSAEQLEISAGWQLLGTESEIPVSAFDQACINTVWTYNKDSLQWNAYSYNAGMMNLISTNGINALDSVHERDGFWVNAYYDCTITVPDTKCIDDNTTENDYIDDNSTYYDDDNETDPNDYMDDNGTFFDEYSDEINGSKLYYNGVTEAEGEAHTLYWTQAFGVTAYAYYSIGSDLAQNPAETGDYYFTYSENLYGTDPFMALQTALMQIPSVVESGYSMTDLKLEFGESNLGDDVESIDWSYSDGVETRNYYGVGDYAFKLGDIKLFGAKVPNSKMTLDYTAAAMDGNVTMSVVSEYTTPVNLVPNTQPVLKALVDEFLSNLNGYKLRFVTDSTDAIIQADGTFNTTNTYVEIGK
ncbi:MAG: hypothetical protein JXQ66_00085 [Campylobacterales bacterium]|nr:hypothetical protein [Campylobacterales bacterium]